jgi:large subunit ribosomal protein L4
MVAETNYLSVDVFSQRGRVVGKARLPKEIFGFTPEQIQAKKAMLHEVVTAIRSGLRQGTHSTKTRGEVSGGGRKPFRQKGTGQARQGSSREPQMTGGGVAHGPKPHSHAKRVNGQKYAQSLRLALSDRANNANVLVLENLNPGASPSTKKVAQALIRNRIASASKVLVITAQDDHNAYLSVRNLPNTEVVFPRNVNVYDVLRTQKVIFDVKSLVELTKDPELVTIDTPKADTSKRTTVKKAAPRASVKTKATENK